MKQRKLYSKITIRNMQMPNNNTHIQADISFLYTYHSSWQASYQSIQQNVSVTFI